MSASSDSLILFKPHEPCKSLDDVRKQVYTYVDKKYHDFVDMRRLTLFASLGCTYQTFYSEVERLIQVQEKNTLSLVNIRIANANADIADEKRKQEETKTLIEEKIALQEEEKLTQEKKRTIERAIQEEARTREANAKAAQCNDVNRARSTASRLRGARVSSAPFVSSI